MSKRIDANEKIYNDINKTVLEYHNKIELILIDILNNHKINFVTSQIIHGILFVNELTNNSRYTRSYNDKYDRTIYPDYFNSYHFVFDSINEVWPHIENIINEGNKKIHELADKFEQPKKRCTISNFSTKDEYDKVDKSYKRYYIDGQMSYDEFKTSMLDLNNKATELNII